MTSRLEQICTAALALAETVAGATEAGPIVTRSEVLPTDIPANGWINLVVGTPEEIDATLGVVSVHWQVVLQFEIAVEGATGPLRATAMETLATALATALDVDPAAGGDQTLGGVCDYARILELEAPEDLAVLGAEGAKAATLPVVVDYTTGANPLEAI